MHGMIKETPGGNTGDSIRRAKYPYTVDLVKGATSTADRTEQWFPKRSTPHSHANPPSSVAVLGPP